MSSRNDCSLHFNSGTNCPVGFHGDAPLKLDDAYANAPYIPDANSYLERWPAAAAAFRASLGGRAETDVSYGPSARQAFDLFRSAAIARGTLVFVHGGYWLRFGKGDWSHLAAGAQEHGWNAAHLGYDLCPEVRISDITRQIAAGVTTVAARTEGPISLAGHSAGGHLVSRILAPSLLSPEVRDRIVAVAPISPVADLRPLLETSMNADFKMTLADAEAESPVLQPPPDVPVHLWVGADERPAFIAQCDALAQAWGVSQTVAPGKHHFDIIEALEAGDSDMIRFLCARE